MVDIGAKALYTQISLTGPDKRKVRNRRLQRR
jgi:hypothetical protein